MKNGEWDLPPVITFGEDEFVEISFDDLKHEYARYNYVIRHCNADWTFSDILESEYMDGFNTNTIEDYTQSMATKVEYNRYSFTIPNDNVKLLIAGNYCVQIFEEDEDSPIAQCFFSVIEPRIIISAEINGNTDIDTYDSHSYSSSPEHTESIMYSIKTGVTKVLHTQKDGRFTFCRPFVIS